MSRKIMIVAGEHSGDRLGALLVKELIKKDSTLYIFGVGGPLMQAAGVELRKDMTSLAVIGLWEAIKLYHVFKRIFDEVCTWFERDKPDVLILIDFPGFNLRLAKAAKKNNLKVIYYVSPQFWAWGQRRIKVVRDNIHQMIVILPFEKPFYEKHQIACEFVGHPMVDWYQNVEMDEIKSMIGPGSPLIGILPGSRMQEVQRHLPRLIESASCLRKKYPQSLFIIPCASAEIYSYIQKEAALPDYIKIVKGGMQACLKLCQLVWATSGTATLEAGYVGVPMIVVYQVSRLTEWIARLLIKVPYIALVNLVGGEKIVPELLQDDIRAQTINSLSIELLEDTPRKREMIEKLSQIDKKLGPPGANKRAADVIFKSLGWAA